jgi:hypothetical protein
MNPRAAPLSAARPQPKTRFLLPIADRRLTIEEVVWQFPPPSIGPAKRDQSKIGSSAILGQLTMAEILLK